ncbi:hypothetical protein PFISCL1PPCAC_18677, partial [Pristionchus fissidentatus]
FSNMLILRNQSFARKRQLSIFEPTPELAPHQISLALNDYGFEPFPSKMFKVRLITPVENYSE